MNMIFGKTIARYLRIDTLIKELKDRLDNNKIPFGFCRFWISYKNFKGSSIYLTKRKYLIYKIMKIRI